MLPLLIVSLCLAGTAFGLVATRQESLVEIPSEAYIQVEIDPDGVTWPWRVFKSSPFTPPNMTITGNGGELAEGYIFMTPASTDPDTPYTKEAGGFIMTSEGDLVFAQIVPGYAGVAKCSKRALSLMDVS